MPVGRGDVAVTPHALATDAAMRVYGLGGNAVDAAIAANAVQGVVAPETCGVGGDLFALIHRPGDERPSALNASGRAGSGANAALLRGAGHASIPPFDSATVTIPGCVDGWSALSERFGAMPLSDVLAPAIGLAEDGFPMSTELARALTRRSDRLAPQAPELYRSPPRPGTLVYRRDLGRTLRQIAEGGRTAFYEGAAGAAITSAVDSIARTDLAAGRADWVEPISTSVFERTGWTIPPNSQGYLTLASSWIFAHTAPPSDPDDPDFVHLQIEAYRSVAWERDDLVADPEFAPIEPDLLTAPERLRARADAIDRSRTGSWPHPDPAPGGTAYLCFIDRDDLAVSLIQSNYMGIGSGIAAPGTGFFLQNRGAGFNLIEGHPNELAPGKRPLHTLSPSIWTRGGRIDTVLGTRGGHYQPQLLLQMATASFHAGLDPTAAQARPRWVIDAERLRVESPMSDRIVSGLERRGHAPERAGTNESGWGPVSIIRVADDGTRDAAADIRVETARAAIRR